MKNMKVKYLLALLLIVCSVATGYAQQITVERGLVPGETIVVEGYHKLSPGVKVKVNNALLKKEEGEEVDERRREQGDKEPSV